MQRLGRQAHTIIAEIQAEINRLLNAEMSKEHKSATEAGLLFKNEIIKRHSALGEPKKLPIDLHDTEREIEKRIYATFATILSGWREELIDHSEDRSITSYQALSNYYFNYADKPREIIEATRKINKTKLNEAKSAFDEAHDDLFAQADKIKTLAKAFRTAEIELIIIILLADSEVCLAPLIEQLNTDLASKRLFSNQKIRELLSESTKIPRFAGIYPDKKLDSKEYTPFWLQKIKPFVSAIEPDKQPEKYLIIMLINDALMRLDKKPHANKNIYFLVFIMALATHILPKKSTKLTVQPIGGLGTRKLINDMADDLDRKLAGAVQHTAEQLPDHPLYPPISQLLITEYPQLKLPFATNQDSKALPQVLFQKWLGSINNLKINIQEQIKHHSAELHYKKYKLYQKLILIDLLHNELKKDASQLNREHIIICLARAKQLFQKKELCLKKQPVEQFFADAWHDVEIRYPHLAHIYQHQDKVIKSTFYLTAILPEFLTLSDKFHLSHADRPIRSFEKLKSRLLAGIAEINTELAARNLTNEAALPGILNKFCEAKLDHSDLISAYDLLSQHDEPFEVAPGMTRSDLLLINPKQEHFLFNLLILQDLLNLVERIISTENEHEKLNYEQQLYILAYLIRHSIAPRTMGLKSHEELINFFDMYLNPSAELLKFQKDEFNKFVNHIDYSSFNETDIPPLDTLQKLDQQHVEQIAVYERLLSEQASAIEAIKQAEFEEQEARNRVVNLQKIVAEAKTRTHEKSRIDAAAERMQRRSITLAQKKELFQLTMSKLEPYGGPLMIDTEIRKLKNARHGIASLREAIRLKDQLFKKLGFIQIACLAYKSIQPSYRLSVLH